MNSQPPPRPRPGDGFASSMIVRAAVEALEAEYGQLTYREAKERLPQWTGYGDLTAPEREAVLSRFPHECHDIGTGWISGSC